MQQIADLLIAEIIQMHRKSTKLDIKEDTWKSRMQAELETLDKNSSLGEVSALFFRHFTWLATII